MRSAKNCAGGAIAAFTPAAPSLPLVTSRTFNAGLGVLEILGPQAVALAVQPCQSSHHLSTTFVILEPTGTLTCSTRLWINHSLPRPHEATASAARANRHHLKLLGSLVKVRLHTFYDMTDELSEEIVTVVDDSNNHQGTVSWAAITISEEQRMKPE